MLLTRNLYAILFLLIIISCVSKNNIEREVLFQATYDSGVGGCSLVFYKDSTCLWMGGIASDDKEGKYHMHDNTIILEGIPIETCLKSNRLLITNFNPNQNKNGQTILVQVDSESRIVDSIHIFTKL